MEDWIMEESSKHEKSEVHLPALLACLLLWQVWLEGTQGMPTGVGCWDNRMCLEEGWRKRSESSGNRINE